MTALADGRILRVHKCVLLINVFPQFPTPAYELIGGIMLEALEVLLHIHNGVEISSVSDVKGQLAQVRTSSRDVACGEKGFHVTDFDRLHFLSLLLVFDAHEAGRHFQI